MNSTELPVLIGVTGHRDLLDPQQVRKQLIAFFQQIGDAMPNTKFCLVSGLAVGADQLFIACGKKVLGERAETFAVLPFAREEYEKDFSEPELADFRRLLDAADYVEELPGSRDDEAAAYSAEGTFLVEHVNILVSIWDGNIACNPNGTPKRGGTWENSDLWMNYEHHNPKDLFSTFRISTLIKIPAERIPKETRVDKPYQIKDFGIDRDKKLVSFDINANYRNILSKFFSDRKADYAFEQIDAYNAMCRKESPGRAVSKQYLGIADATGVEKDIERFSVLDDSANITQKKYGKQFIWIFTLSFLLGVFAQIYGGVNHEFLSFDIFNIHYRPVTWSLPAYFLLVISVFAYSITQRYRGIDNKYLDHRILAELLRIVIFWKISHIKENVKDLFFRKDPEHVEWIVIALHNWSILDEADPHRRECINSTDVRKAWVEDQLKYYSKTAERLKAKANNIHKKALIVAGISMFLGVYFFIDTFVFTITPHWLNGPLYACNGILVGFGSFFMASLNFFLEKKGWDETAESYLSKAKLFGVILKCLEQMPPEKIPIYLSYLGHTAIQEHEEWLNQQRQRKPEPNI